VQLVGRGDDTRIDMGDLQVLDIRLLALQVRWLRILERIGACLDDAGDSLAEAGMDLVEHRVASVVFRGVVQ
jgi:hypothetical protein